MDATSNELSLKMDYLRDPTREHNLPIDSLDRAIEGGVTSRKGTNGRGGSFFFAHEDNQSGPLGS